jgi:hypothetical protein
MGIVGPIWFQCFVLIFTLWNREIDHCIFPLSNKRFHVCIIGEILKFFLNGATWGNESYKNSLWVCVRIEIAMNLWKEKELGRMNGEELALAHLCLPRARKDVVASNCPSPEGRNWIGDWNLPEWVSIQYRVRIIHKKT